MAQFTFKNIPSNLDMWKLTVELPHIVASKAQHVGFKASATNFTLHVIVGQKLVL